MARNNSDNSKNFRPASGRTQPVFRSDGVTPAERYLKKLCEQTFLSLWSYPNVYGEKGKEVCDLLVVFEKDIIIFSDKHRIVPRSGDIYTDWKKWFRRAVEKSAKQAWGAERWIRANPNRLFLEPQCTQPFPLDLPNMSEARFHLVVVAHDIAKRCAEQFGGSGSLMIRSDLVGAASHVVPFTVGDLDRNRSFVHVFDDVSLRIVMDTVDTISDFVAYLNKKEILLRSQKHIFAAGEEELLAVYLKNLNPQGEHDFIFPGPENVDGIALTEGHWEKFQEHPQRLAQIEADRVSYFWDRLIEEFNKNALEGSQEYVSPPSIKSSERVMRLLAAQPRYMRRMLASGFLEIVEKTPSNQRMLRIVPPIQQGEPYFVFLVFPFRQDRSYKENRLVRRNFLDACCRVVKLRYPDALEIVGVATESGRMNREAGSEDATYFDARYWTKEHEQEAKELQSKLGILVDPIQKPIRVNEYPEPSSVPSAFVPVVGRNDKCPCGSGRKYKKCHGGINREQPLHPTANPPSL